MVPGGQKIIVNKQGVINNNMSAMGKMVNGPMMNRVRSQQPGGMVAQPPRHQVSNFCPKE